MMKIFKRMVLIVSVIIIALLISAGAFTQQVQFGKLPSGERLERIKKSPNFKDGQFQNLSKTSVMSEDVSYFKVMKEFFFSRNKRRAPSMVLPSKKIDLLTLSKDSNTLVWFGHSSYFMQIDGKRFLVDPVLCGSASPVKFTTKSFKGSDVYAPEEIPEIDYLFITHDHWDHLNYETLMRLKPKIKKVITGLGVGSHLEYWGFDKKIIFENDWFDELQLDSGFSVKATPARHFSGRLFKRNETLWVSFVLKTPTMKIFLGGDGGYDTHFADIGKNYGPFDIAILECGQYDKSWKYIHSLPDEVAKEVQDLNAKMFLAVHWGKFQLAIHDWDAPIKAIYDLSKTNNLPIITPMIGEKVNLESPATYSAWWEQVQ